MVEIREICPLGFLWAPSLVISEDCRLGKKMSDYPGLWIFLDQRKSSGRGDTGIEKGVASGFQNCTPPPEIRDVKDR